MAKENKPAYCPNCHKPAIRQGNEIICETCDATFTITKKDGAKVKQIGRIEQVEQDVAALKAKVFDQDAEPEPESAADSDNDDDGSQGDDTGSQSEDKDDW